MNIRGGSLGEITISDQPRVSHACLDVGWSPAECQYEIMFTLNMKYMQVEGSNTWWTSRV
jgi:hypothetical protein